MRRLLLLALVVSSLAVACGGNGGSQDSSAESGGHEGHEMEGGQGSAMGATAEASEADRTVEIVMLDQLAYDPEEIEVEEGEVVTFEVVNEGKTTHEFVLGDGAYQKEHEQEMTDGAGHGDMSGNALSLEPGDRGSLTWRFTEPGDVLYGCHEPGHYEGGMVGRIKVS